VRWYPASLVPRTLRGRITLAYAVGLALVVTAGLALAYVGLTAQLRNAAVQDLGTRLDDLAAAVEVGGTAVVERDPYAQLLAGGQVVARSPATPTVPVLAGDELAAAAEKRVTVRRAAPGLGDSALLIAEPVRGGRIVLAGTSLSTVELAADRILLGLTVLGPLLLVALTLAVRRLFDTALAPVASLTEAADSLVLDGRPNPSLPQPSGDDEIAKLARTLNTMLARLSAAQERERAFIDDAAHELRTPVAVLRAELELGLTQEHDAAHRPPSTPTREALRRALAEADRLGRLADGLLVLAQARSGQLDLDRQPTDVTALVRAWTGRLSAVTGARVSVAGPELVATVDPARVEQVVTNLVGNAAEAGAGRVEVRVAAEPPGGVRMEVSDDGPGFAPAVLPVAFDRFSRGAVPGPPGLRGAGLGLAIVATVARAHGGSVEAGNGSPLGGAWVRVVLP
jgi:two-component system, OmpR family, sensor kinase